MQISCTNQYKNAQHLNNTIMLKRKANIIKTGKYSTILIIILTFAYFDFQINKIF